MTLRQLTLVASFAVITHISLAQSPRESCPIRIKKVDTSNGFKAGLAAAVTGTPDSRGYFLIDYVNDSERSVATVRFGVGYINSMHELSYVDTVTTKEQKIKPGKSFTVVGANGYITGGEKMRSVGWVQKVLFTDGAYWNDDGSRACGTLEPSEAVSAGSQILPHVMNASTPYETAALIQAGAVLSTVTSIPQGASISVDGKPMGTTPAIFLLKHGEKYKITLSDDGFQPAEQELTPGANLVVPLSSK